MSENNKHRSVMWDIYIRVYHWLLAILVLVSFVSIEVFDNLDVHFMSGFGIIGLLVFRAVWGIFGSETAKFVNFVRHPSEIIKYMKSLVNPKTHKINYGHSPIAGLSVVAMLLILVFQVLSGLFYYDEEIFLEGPLAQYGSEGMLGMALNYHPIGANLVLTLVVIHLLAIAIYYFVYKDNLISPMIKGWREFDAKKILKVNHFIAIFCIVLAAVTVGLIAYYGN